MSIRIKIAQWLAPELAKWKFVADKWEETSWRWIELAIIYEKRAADREAALLNIASQRTPRANATVNRMADMAEAELKGEG